MNEHCPHGTGKTLIKFPAVNEVICCHCGIFGKQNLLYTKPAGHGTYAPEYVIDMSYTWPNEECVDK